MSFQMSQDLFLERTLVVAATIVIFGIVSIGALWLVRRAMYESPGLGMFDRLRARASGAAAGLSDVIGEIEALARSARAAAEHLQQITRSISKNNDHTR